MSTRVMRALRDSGCRKTLTPLEMASVPVSAEPPEAKAFMTTKTTGPEQQAAAPASRRGPRPGWCNEWAWS